MNDENESYLSIVPEIRFMEKITHRCYIYIYILNLQCAR